MAPARIPAPPTKNPKSSFDLHPGHRTNPNYGARAHPSPPQRKTLKVVMIYSPGTALTLSDGARAHPCPPRKKTLKVVFIYTPGTTLTLSMAPAHIPGPPEQNPKSSFDLYPGHRTNPKHGARAKPCPFRKKP